MSEHEAFEWARAVPKWKRRRELAKQEQIARQAAENSVTEKVAQLKVATLEFLLEGRG